MTGLSKELDQCAPDELWRGVLSIELKRLSEAEQHVTEITARLNALANANASAEELMKFNGVGPRAAEIVVATIDDPLRFASQIVRISGRILG